MPTHSSSIPARRLPFEKSVPNRETFSPGGNDGGFFGG